MSDVLEARMCFACGVDNPIGLRIAFAFDGGIHRALRIVDRNSAPA